MISPRLLRTGTCVFYLLLSQTAIAAGDPVRDLRTREFVVMGYLGIQSDLDRGEGPYLETLKDLLGVAKTDEDGLVPQLRDLAKTHPNIMDFADHVTALQRQPSKEALLSIPVPTGPTVVQGAEIENALRHLSRGSPVTLYLANGQRLDATFVEYQVKRAWLRGASRASVQLKEIVAVDTKPIVR